MTSSKPHNEYSVAGELPGASVANVRAALAALGAPIRVHDEISFVWEAEGVDVNFEAVLLSERGVDYMLTGSLALERAAAYAWLRALSGALDALQIRYQLELDDPSDLQGDTLLTLTSA